MPRFGQGLLTGLLVALLPGVWPASSTMAQQAGAPLLLPKSDVAVVYRFDGVALDFPRKMQITYAKASELVRVDYFRWFEAKYPYLSLIFDRPANRLISVQPERKAYIERPIGSHNNPGALLTAEMTLTRQGADVVAHAPCSVWKLEAPGRSDEGATACITDDGIVLRLGTTKPTVTTLTATTIHYGAPPAGVFDPPEGFKRETAP